MDRPSRERGANLQQLGRILRCIYIWLRQEPYPTDWRHEPAPRRTTVRCAGKFTSEIMEVASGAVRKGVDLDPVLFQTKQPAPPSGVVLLSCPADDQG